MPSETVFSSRSGGAWGVVGALAASEGSGNHPHVGALRLSLQPLRDLADAVHYLCLLHGQHPGVIDHALAHSRSAMETVWLEAVAGAFAEERAYIVRLVAAAGPLPSTPGQAESEAAALHQRHALEMLAQSDRVGCATGAALALVLDWQAVRDVLDAAADRLGLASPPTSVALIQESATVATELARNPLTERAMRFGAQQLFAQHRGLWDLLEARAGARSPA